MPNHKTRIVNGHKQCTKCKEWKPATLEYFPSRPKLSSGLDSWCNECHRANCAKYYTENVERERLRTRIYQRTRRANDPEYVERQREVSRRNYKRMRKECPEKLRANGRRATQKWRSKPENREKANANSRQRYWENHAEVRRRANEYNKKTSYRVKRRAAQQRYKARKMSADGKYTDEDIKTIYAQQAGRCWYCQCGLGDDYHADHRVPLSRGGSNYPENIVLACPKCNQSKSDKLPHEWNGRLL